MSDIERFRVVATLARTRSMNMAARAQSTVTRYVAVTERTLGYALFERGPGGSSPRPRVSRHSPSSSGSSRASTN